MIYTWPNGSATIPHVTDEWGMRVNPVDGGYRLHAGIDLVGFAHNRSAADGVVTFAAYNGGAGLQVTVRHDDGRETRYFHHRELWVAVGQRVQRGDILGVQGTTGQSTGVHCHFETRNSPTSSSVNPRDFMSHMSPAGGGGVGFIEQRKIKNMSTLYGQLNTAGSATGLYALAGESPGTPANWEETTDYKGVAIPWADGHSYAVMLTPDSWAKFKADHLSPLNVGLDASKIVVSPAQPIDYAKLGAAVAAAHFDELAARVQA